MWRAICVSFVVAVAIMARINWRITLFVFLPLVVAYAIGRGGVGQDAALPRGEGLAEDAVTGFLAEMFGAVQAVKVAGAEAARRGALPAVGRNPAPRRHPGKAAGGIGVRHAGHRRHVGVGVMLLLAGQAMSAGRFTVGDFALFTYYLWFTTELPSYLGTFVGDIKQQEVAIGRLAELVPDEPLEALVEHHPVSAETSASDSSACRVRRQVA